MTDKDFETIEAMRQWGGSFVKTLADLAMKADPINLRKIKATWPEYWERYEQMAEEKK